MDGAHGGAACGASRYGRDGSGARERGKRGSSGRERARCGRASAARVERPRLYSLWTARGPRAGRAFRVAALCAAPRPSPLAPRPNPSPNHAASTSLGPPSPTPPRARVLRAELARRAVCWAQTERSCTLSCSRSARAAVCARAAPSTFASRSTARRYAVACSTPARPRRWSRSRRPPRRWQPGVSCDELPSTKYYTLYV